MAAAAVVAAMSCPAADTLDAPGYRDSLGYLDIPDYLDIPGDTGYRDNGHHSRHRHSAFAGRRVGRFHSL